MTEYFPIPYAEEDLYSSRISVVEHYVGRGIPKKYTDFMLTAISYDWAKIAEAHWETVEGDYNNLGLNTSFAEFCKNSVDEQLTMIYSSGALSGQISTLSEKLLTNGKYREFMEIAGQVQKYAEEGYWDVGPGSQSEGSLLSISTADSFDDLVVRLSSRSIGDLLFIVLAQGLCNLEAPGCGLVTRAEDGNIDVVGTKKRIVKHVVGNGDFPAVVGLSHG